MTKQRFKKEFREMVEAGELFRKLATDLSLASLETPIEMIVEWNKDDEELDQIRQRSARLEEWLMKLYRS